MELSTFYLFIYHSADRLSRGLLENTEFAFFGAADLVLRILTFFTVRYARRAPVEITNHGCTYVLATMCTWLFVRITVFADFGARVFRWRLRWTAHTVPLNQSRIATRIARQLSEI